MSAEGQLVDQFSRPVQMVATPSGWRIEVLGDPLPPEMHGPSIWVDPNGEGRPNGTFPVKHPNSGLTDKQKPTAPKAVKPIDNGTQGRVYTMPLPPPSQPKSELADYAERSAEVLEGYVEGLVEPVVESAKLAVEGWQNIVTEPVEAAKALDWGAKELGGMALDGWRQIAGDPQQAVDAFVWAGKEALAKANEILAGAPKDAGRLVGEAVGSVLPVGASKAAKIKATPRPSVPNSGATILKRRPTGPAVGTAPKGLPEITLRKDGWPDLPGTEARNFGDAVPVELPEGTKIYRIIDENSNPAGSYWALELPDGKSAWRYDYAVLENWNSNGLYVEHTVGPGGLRVWQGPAAAQSIGNGTYFPGGGTQIWMPPNAVPPPVPKRTGWQG